MTYDEAVELIRGHTDYGGHVNIEALALAISTPASSVADAQVDDLRMLVQRLVHALNKAAPDNDLSEKALDYLKREGLTGSPWRADAEKDSALTEELIKEIADGHGIWPDAAFMVCIRAILAANGEKP